MDVFQLATWAGVWGITFQLWTLTKVLRECKIDPMCSGPLTDFLTQFRVLILQRPHPLHLLSSPAAVGEVPAATFGDHMPLSHFETFSRLSP